MTADAAATPPTPRPSDEKAGLHHLAFRTTPDEFETMIDWYRNVLDMEINFRGKRHDREVCFLLNDRANHRIVMISKSDFVRDPGYARRARLDHSAFEFPTIDGLLAKYAQLRDQGIQPYLSIDHGLTISIYFRDPVGHGVELQTDAFGDWDLSREWMRAAEEFASNWSGILFDPDKVIVARNAGADLAELHRRIYTDGEFWPRPEQRKQLGTVSDVRPEVWDHATWGPDHPTFG